mgnify:CR=1 FL=1
MASRSRIEIQGSKHLAVYPYISICSGAGGLDLGVELASGGRAVPVVYVENELTSASVLASRVAEESLAPGNIFSSVKEFDFSDYHGCKGVVAGYPCGPFSNSGRRTGVRDQRWLWPYIRDGINTIRDGLEFVFLENVPGHLTLGGFEVFKDLQQMGLRTAATLLSAEEVGGTHRRERLFILAVADTYGGIRQGGYLEVDAAYDAGPPGTTLRHRFPPSPASPDWDVVLPTQPWLHPTVVPEFLGGSHGLAAGVDLSRNDRNRICGLGVVPQQAARAWEILEKDLL